MVTAQLSRNPSAEILEDRWRGAIDGNETSEYGDLFSADGLALIDLLNRFVMKVARAEDIDAHLDAMTPHVSIVDECIEAIHETILGRINEFALAR